MDQEQKKTETSPRSSSSATGRRKTPAAKRTPATRSSKRRSSGTARSKTLAAKLADVQFELSKKEIPANGKAEVWKDGELKYSYTYVRESDLMRAIRGELALRNVAVLYSDGIVSSPSKDDPTTTVEVSIRFIDGDSDDELEIFGQGYAFDRGDRGANKAKTHAVRYLLWKTFLVPAEEDPEAEGSEDVPRFRAEAAAGPSERPRETSPAPARSGRLERSQRRERLIARLREVAEEKDARLAWEPGTSLTAALANYGTANPEDLSDDELVTAGVELSTDVIGQAVGEPVDPDSDVPF